MPLRGIVGGLVVVVVVTLWSGTAAQSGCTSALTSMSPCLSYVMGSSLTPSLSRCSQLSSVLQSSLQYLCSLLNGGASSLGITINQTLALSLPGACKVQTPPISQCKGGNGPKAPATAPVDSPVCPPADSTTPSASDIPSGAGSKTVPSVDGGSSDGSTIKVPFHWVISLLSIVSCVSLVAEF